MVGVLQVLHEHLDGTADTDESHRFARVVEHDGEFGVLPLDLTHDLFGESGRLGHGRLGEPVHL